MNHYIGNIPYRGEERLVIGLDVGTTQSKQVFGHNVVGRADSKRIAGVSFAHLTPGMVPQVEMVCEVMVMVFYTQIPFR